MDEYLAAIKAAVAPTPRAEAPSVTQLEIVAVKADGDEGIIIAKVSKAENFDRQDERVPLDVLTAATYELVAKIGTKAIEVDVNHENDAIKCDVLMAWIGDPMPDPLATYVALRPHDAKVYEAAKAGEIIGMSWSGPYKLKEASA